MLGLPYIQGVTYSKYLVGGGGVGGGALWANRPSNENAKGSKKLRPIAQNSGHVARRPEVSIEILLNLQSSNLR